MKRNGFTLMELMIVIVIIGILSAVGMVMFGGQAQKAKIAVVKSNHNLVKKYIIFEIIKCNSLDIEFDSITNKSYHTKPSTNCSTNKNCAAVKNSGSPGNGWYLTTAICPLLYYDMIKNPFDNNSPAFEQSYAIPPTNKVGYTFVNVDGATGLGYKISSRFGTGANDYITQTIPFPD